MLYSQVKIVLKIIFWTNGLVKTSQKCHFWSKNDDDDEIKPNLMLQNMPQSRSRDGFEAFLKSETVE